jgi:hypothetical protein
MPARRRELDGVRTNVVTARVDVSQSEGVRGMSLADKHVDLGCAA